MKTVSVIIPAYNREAYIEEAINSVLTQKIPKNYKLEVIVVDDGSTDNTVKTVKRFGNKVTLIEAEHSGKPAVPRNIGIKASRGEIIAFQDSDDLWTPEKLSVQLPVFDDPSVVFSFGNAEIMQADGTKTGKRVIKKSDLLDANNLDALLAHNSVSTLTVMIRKSALDSVGEFNERDDLRAVEDYELWLRFAAMFPNGLKPLADTLAYYRVHDHNISTTDDLVAIERIMNVLESAMDQASGESKAAIETRLLEMEANWVRLKDETDSEDKPLVSVVMSVYNGGPHLKHAIDSILAQTFRDFEFIIIDDGSTDASAELIKTYTDPRIRLLSQTNHGLVYSLNKGIRLSRGAYIARQDADDISLPSRLEKELLLMSADPEIGLVGSFFTYVNEKTLEPGLTLTFPTLDIDIKRAMYYTNPIGHGTALIRKEVFKETALYTRAYGPTEDFELWRRIADNWKLAIVPEPLYWYRLNPNSISHTEGDAQHAYTDQLHDEQWAKPFFYKSPHNIIRDSATYQRLPLYGHILYGQYVSQQVDIGRELFRRGRLKFALKTAYGAWRLDHKTWKLFVRPMARGLKHRLRGGGAL